MWTLLAVAKLTLEWAGIVSDVAVSVCCLSTVHLLATVGMVLTKVCGISRSYPLRSPLSAICRSPPIRSSSLLHVPLPKDARRPRCAHVIYVSTHVAPLFSTVMLCTKFLGAGLGYDT